MRLSVHEIIKSGADEDSTVHTCTCVKFIFLIFYSVLYVKFSSHTHSYFDDKQNKFKNLNFSVSLNISHVPYICNISDYSAVRRDGNLNISLPNLLQSHLFTKFSMTK